MKNPNRIPRNDSKTTPPLNLKSFALSPEHYHPKVLSDIELRKTIVLFRAEQNDEEIRVAADGTLLITHPRFDGVKEEFVYGALCEISYEEALIWIRHNYVGKLTFEEAFELLRKNTTQRSTSMQCSFTDSDVAEFFKHLDGVNQSLDKIKFLHEAVLNSLDYWRSNDYPSKERMGELINGFHRMRNEWEVSMTQHDEKLRLLWAKFSPVLTGALVNDLSPNPNGHAVAAA